MKDECNSLEEEKKFVLTQLIGLLTFIAILIGVFADLSISQISFDIGTSTKNIFGLKVVFASFVLIFSFQIYKIVSLFYLIVFHKQILQIINVPEESIDTEKITIFPIMFTFLILFIYRLSPWMLSVPMIPIGILGSITYSGLLFFSGLEAASRIIVVIWESKFSEVLEKQLMDEKKMHLFLASGVIQLFLMIGLIIWIMINLEIPPYELIDIQLKSGLVIISILFILIYWGKPLYLRLNKIAMKIEQLRKLTDEVLHCKITTAEEIISERDKLKIY